MKWLSVWALVATAAVVAGCDRAPSSPPTPKTMPAPGSAPSGGASIGPGNAPSDPAAPKR